MTYNVFSGTLNLTQPTDQCARLYHGPALFMLRFGRRWHQ